MVVQLRLSPLAQVELWLSLLVVEMEIILRSLLVVLRCPLISEGGLGRHIGGDITFIHHIISFKRPKSFPIWFSPLSFLGFVCTATW